MLKTSVPTNPFAERGPRELYCTTPETQNTASPTRTAAHRPSTTKTVPPQQQRQLKRASDRNNITRQSAQHPTSRPRISQPLSKAATVANAAPGNPRLLTIHTSRPRWTATSPVNSAGKHVLHFVRRPLHPPRGSAETRRTLQAATPAQQRPAGRILTTPEPGDAEPLGAEEIAAIAARLHPEKGVGEMFARVGVLRSTESVGVDGFTQYGALLASRERAEPVALKTGRGSAGEVGERERSGKRAKVPVG